MENPGKVYGEKKVKSLWEQICAEFAAEHADFEDRDFDDASSIATDVTQFSARRHTPVVYGKMVHRSSIDASVTDEFDAAIGHPAAVGLTLLARPKPPPTPPPSPPPDPKTCTPQEYLEAYIFPTLMPAMIAMLKQARQEKCFDRKKFRFNGCDFLTEYLYKNNKGKTLTDRESVRLSEIPFVKDCLSVNPRKPLPLSLQWSEDEAALKIQSYYRGHLARIHPEVAELRKWQKEWREDNRSIRDQVEQFWEEHESKAGDVEQRSTSRASTSSKKSQISRKSTPKHS
ncbi:IQ domain-containing protein K-like isoform X1 [Clavelina lepadiformis]|uniref:IQ domain-containing protein K-like isoform X1 n=1 Tax=Clavelina lepadiformis TaxID=159417 RepID=UPI00404232F9